MEWDNKVKMAHLLNRGMYKEAVELFGNEQDWDEQAVEMFVNGFDLGQYELLTPIKERITNVESTDMRTAMRLGLIQIKFEQ